MFAGVLIQPLRISRQRFPRYINQIQILLFLIPTPVGKYSPDWAIAFKEGKIKYVYFIAETKGTNESTELKSMEQAKIKCAEKLFEKLSNGEVHYGQVKDYKSLMDIVLDR